MGNPFNPAQIERPDPLLMRYYFVMSLLTLPAFPITLFVYWCRYVTLRYKFDDDGVSMSYGVFFRREVNLTFRRIQDIHVTRNLLQRWMGLATISLQTASGNAQAELAIEGVLEYGLLRDYLYARMRGARNQATDDVVMSSIVPFEPPVHASGGSVTAGASTDSRGLQTLIEIRNALQVLVEREGAKA